METRFLSLGNATKTKGQLLILRGWPTTKGPLLGPKSFEENVSRGLRLRH